MWHDKHRLPLVHALGERLSVENLAPRKFKQSKPKARPAPKSRPNRSVGASAPGFDIHTARPYPPSMRAVLRYQDTQKINLSASAGSYTQYSCNSAYDPLYVAGGGVPTGFPEYARMYTRYYVDAVEVAAHFVNNSTVSCELRAFILPLPYDQVTTFPPAAAIVPDVLEAQNATTVTVTNISGGFRDAVVTMKRRVVPWSLEGYPTAASSYFDMSALVTADPLRQPLLLVGAVSSDYLSGAGRSYDLNVVLAYHVRFFGPTTSFSL